MKAVAPRIDKLYEKEVERWRAAWDQFDKTLWSHLRRDEVQAYDDYFDSEPTAELTARIEQLMGHWLDEVRAQLGRSVPGEEEKRRAEAFFEAFMESVPALLEDVDLTRWPSDAPSPSDEEPQEAQREEDTIIRLCRTKKGKGDMERMAAALLILNVAACKTARSYSREKA